MSALNTKEPRQTPGSLWGFISPFAVGVMRLTKQGRFCLMLPLIQLRIVRLLASHRDFPVSHWAIRTVPAFRIGEVIGWWYSEPQPKRIRVSFVAHSVGCKVSFPCSQLQQSSLQEE